MKLFGTDGIRGEFDVEPLVPETIELIGKAIGAYSAEAKGEKIVIGMDTRESCASLFDSLTKGIVSQGIDVMNIGILPTAAVAYFTRLKGAFIGIMISASHNPAQDNGIKMFNSQGFKFDKEHEIEMRVAHKHFLSDVEVGSVEEYANAREEYVSHLSELFDISKKKVVVDCANGAASYIAQEVLQNAGCEVIAVHCSPNGKNINDNCGALHPEAVGKVVVEHGADVGVAFDGDADRVIFVDEKGEVINGDHVLALCALSMKKNGSLSHNTVVSTVMANVGFMNAMASHDITVMQTKVGDKYVIEEMNKGGFSLGGEQSGHIIMMDYTTTGDGLVSALYVLSVLDDGEELSSRAACMVSYPQVLVNVCVTEKRDLELMKNVGVAIENVEKELGSEGRVLVRYSGTEQLCRVMVEGKDLDQINEFANQIADEVKKEIGVNEA